MREDREDGAEERQEIADAAGAAEAPEAGAGAPETDLRAECEALRERYLRLAAEYDNYRKRTDRERTEIVGRSQAQLVKQLLDPLDDLQRVAHYSAETTSVAVLLEGVQMVERKLLRALETAGLEVIEAHGQAFNPEHHEALLTAPTEHEAEDESVGDVFQKGYRFRGELLRPARVAVRKYGG
jgi:molecular chaperone GrpE